MMECLLKSIIEGNINGYNGRGILRAEYMTEIMKYTNKEIYKNLKELNCNRVVWRTVIK